MTSTPFSGPQPISLSRADTGELWREASKLGEAHFYPPGVELLTQGSVAKEIYLLDSGMVKLMRSEDNGRQLVLGLRFSGSFLGSAAALSRRPHPCSVISSLRCGLVRIRRDAFLELLSIDVRFSSYFHYILSDEILDQSALLSEIACLPARQRLEQLLWEILERGYERRIQDSKFQLPLKHWEAAQLLAITPTYLSRLLAELESEEIISRTSGWISVREPASLWHRIDPTPLRVGAIKVL